MNTVTRIVALGGLTGIRSMAGLATLAGPRGAPAGPLTAVALAAESIADKTPFLGDRTALLPLTGRVLIGAVVGGWVAGQDRRHVIAGGVLGAAMAGAAAHLAYQVRTRLPVPSVVGGLLEDAVVVCVAYRVWHARAGHEAARGSHAGTSSTTTLHTSAPTAPPSPLRGSGGQAIATAAYGASTDELR